MKTKLLAVGAFAALATFAAETAAETDLPAVWPLQAQIDALAAQGGGTLTLGPGVYKTGAIFFKPGVNLHLEEGATILGVDDDAGYPMRETRIEGETCVYYPALVNADGCDGFTISGKGTIDGHGLPTWRAFWACRKVKRNCLNKEPGLVRPRLLYVSNSKNVDVSGVTFKNSKFWTTHYYRCENVVVHDCTIVAEVIDGVRGPSTDAVDIDACRDFTVRNVTMDVNDDAVCVKGGKGPWADDPARCPGNGPSENVLVENCLFKSVCHSCLTLGSECTAVTNVVIRNCRLEGPGNFVNVKMRYDTPQRYANVLAENCTGTCQTFLNARAWMQFTDMKGRTDPPESVMDGLVMRGNTIACDECFGVKQQPYMKFRNCAFDGNAVTFKRYGTLPRPTGE